MPLVIDASYTIALALQEGDVPGADIVGDRLAGEGAIVPAMWRFEVANVLLTAVRRKRIASTLPAVILADLAALAIDVDEAATARAWTATLALAEHHGLTVYDASYLELAIRHGASLASLDGDLAAAARRESLEVFGIQ